MNTVQRIAKNIAVLFTSQVAAFLLSLFYTVYLARYLSAEGFGIFSFALAFTGLFGTLSDIGFYQLTIREVARDKSLASKYLANVSAMRLILGIIVFGLIALTINFLNKPEQTTKVVYLVALGSLFGVFSHIFTSIFQAYERMEYLFLGDLLSRVLSFCAVLVVIKCGFGVVGFAFFSLLISVLASGFNYCLLSRTCLRPVSGWAPWKMEIDWNFWKLTIKEALPFGFAMIFMTIFYKIDSVMLSLMKGDAVVGWYNAAYKMVLALLFIPSSFIGAVYPVMSRYHQGPQESLTLSLEKSLKYLTLLGIPIGVGTTLLAKRFMLLMFGAEYTNSILPLQILVWSSVLIFMSQPFGNLFNCLNRQSIVTRITGICVVFNVVMNLILIPKYSLTGASIVTVLTEFASLTLCLFWAHRSGYSVLKKEFASVMLKVLMSSALMGIFIVRFRDLNLLILVPSAALIYLVVLCMNRAIDEEDVSLVQSVFIKGTR
jgi:O-antigen/teichoic acid export membrane protein